MAANLSSIPEKDLRKYDLKEFLRLQKIDTQEKGVAFLGPAGVGKTTLLSLIDLYLQQEENKMSEKATSQIMEGDRFFEVTEENLSEGRFPARTEENTTERLKLQITVQGSRSPVMLYATDYSGEILESSMEKSTLVKAPDPAYFLLTKVKGQLAYFLSATALAFVIDPTHTGLQDLPGGAKPQNSFIKADFTYKVLLQKLTQARTGNDRGTLNTPVAIVLTKVDTFTSRGESEILKNGGRDWVEHNLPKFSGALTSYVSGKVTYLTSGFETERDPQNPNSLLIKRRAGYPIAVGNGTGGLVSWLKGLAK